MSITIYATPIRSCNVTTKRTSCINTQYTFVRAYHKRDGRCSRAIKRKRSLIIKGNCVITNDCYIQSCDVIQFYSIATSFNTYRSIV